MLTAILGGFLGAITQVLGFFVALGGTLTSFLLELASQILNATISTGLVSLCYTCANTDPNLGATNAFIAVGWGLTRGLTNIIFVVALLAIGLGTALRINEYQAKKSLPLLIVIALLINFTPVILGVIVDASNILMNYFLGSGFQGGSVLANQLSSVWTTYLSGFGRFWDPSQSVNTLVYLLAITAFNVIAAFIFFIFAAIFLMRYVVIWLLVILSPIAFAAYILPATRSIFKKWWTQFIQWTFVGVTAGFFLYLANQLMKMILIDKSVVFTAAGGEGIGFLNYILPWFVIIIFLVLGLQTALSSSAQGANLAINAVKGAPKKFAGTKLGGKLTGGAASMIQRGLAGTPRVLQERLGRVPYIGKGLDWATRPVGWAAGGINRVVGGKLIEYAAQKRKVSTPKGWDQMSITEKEAYINTQTGFGQESDRTVLASKMKGEGTFQKTSSDFRKARLADATKLASNIIYKKEIGDILDALPDKITQKTKVDFELAGISPTEIDTATGRLKRDLEKEKINIKINDIAAEYGVSQDEAAGVLHAQELKPKDISEVSKGSLKTDIFRIATRKMSSSHLEAIQNNLDDETVRAVLDEGKGLNALTDAEVQGMRTKNARLFRWANETPGGKEMLNWSARRRTRPEDREEKYSPEELARRATRMALGEIRREKERRGQKTKPLTENENPP